VFQSGLSAKDAVDRATFVAFLAQAVGLELAAFGEV
jgi:hypothetical protein